MESKWGLEAKNPNGSKGTPAYGQYTQQRASVAYGSYGEGGKKNSGWKRPASSWQDNHSSNSKYSSGKRQNNGKCWEFSSKGYCNFGNKCKFVHG